MKTLLIFIFFIITGCSVSKNWKPIDFERQSFEKTVQGKCRRPGRVILGLDLDYEVASLKFKNDSLHGIINDIGMKWSNQANNAKIIRYDRSLNIYQFDTSNCTYQYLGQSKINGTFAVKFNSSSGVIGFSYFNLDTCCSDIVDAIIIRKAP